MKLSICGIKDKTSFTYAGAIDAIVNSLEGVDHVLGGPCHGLFLRNINFEGFGTEIDSGCYVSAFGGNAACCFKIHVRDNNTLSTVFRQAEGACSPYATSFGTFSICAGEPCRAPACGLLLPPPTMNALPLISIPWQKQRLLSD